MSSYISKTDTLAYSLRFKSGSAIIEENKLIFSASFTGPFIRYMEINNYLDDPTVFVVSKLSNENDKIYTPKEFIEWVK